jgi:hypothetical protein
MIGGRLAQCALALSLGLFLAGCGGSRGVTLEDVAVDKSIVTGSIDRKKAPSADQLSDEATVRNAVSSANLEQLGSGSLAWANSSTGSQGAISAIVENDRSGILCRRFSASRESFRGVALYQGETCRGVDGNWWMKSFTES